MSEYLTREEVADLLKINARSVERLVRQGKLPEPVQLSTRIFRFRKSDLEKVLQGPRPEDTKPAA